MEVEINGKRYRRVESRNRSSNGMSKFLMLTAMFGEMYGIGKKERKRPVVNLEEEYGKIERKESKLSSNDRAWVVGQFKLNYTPID